MKVLCHALRPPIANGVIVLCTVAFVAGAPSTARAAGVVGMGMATSCTDAALNTALAGGGLVTFDCGGPAMIIGGHRNSIVADTTIDGGGRITLSGEGFDISSGIAFTVKSLRIANAPNFGAVVSDGGSLTVINSEFTGNSAFSANRISAGALDLVGAGAISANGTVTIVNSTFTGNSGGLGGAIGVAGTVTITDSTFIGNSASNQDVGAGGAIIFGGVGGSLTVANSTFIGNSYGGGTGGGAIAMQTDTGSLTATIVNSTFTGNGASDDTQGAAISNSGGSLTVTNSILANSSSGNNCSGTITDGGHNLDDGTSCSFRAANGSLSDTNPQLDPGGLQNNGGPTQTLALCTAVGEPAGCTAASPAIEAGDPDICAMAPVNNLDQRGFVRPGTGHANCSIGAYEADAGPPCIGDCNDDGNVSTAELVTGVLIALGTTPREQCPAFACDVNEDVTVDCLVQAVDNALNGCGG